MKLRRLVKLLSVMFVSPLFFALNIFLKDQLFIFCNDILKKMTISLH